MNASPHFNLFIKNVIRATMTCKSAAESYAYQTKAVGEHSLYSPSRNAFAFPFFLARFFRLPFWYCFFDGEGQTKTNPKNKQAMLV